MEISDREKKKRQHKKELNSLRNKMGQNLAWFDSLRTDSKWTFLFLWKSEKKRNKLKVPTKVKVSKRVFTGGRVRIEKVDVIHYPPSLKHFIKKMKQYPRFQPTIKNLRNTTIELLLKNKS